MDIKDQLEITRVNRRILEKILDGHSLAQLNKVPKGFSNNLIWNIAHVIVTQQLLVYRLSGLPLLIDEEMARRYMKGTKAEEDVTQQEVETIKSLLFKVIDRTSVDIDNAIFKEYRAYPTSTGFVLKSVQDAIMFNNFHEGIHLGYILALKKII
ncbi:DinB family protein [Aquimarina addita]|uniref:DinB family protein n=1 Tax=Aquimarina addita TaxID=870485 RepID=A0ABP7XCT1_9FLAO